MNIWSGHPEAVEPLCEHESSSGVQAEIRRLLPHWRTHLQHGCELVDPLDLARDHVWGDADAPIVVVEYGCYGRSGGVREDRAFRGVLRDWLRSGDVCLALRHFPVLDSQPEAWPAACVLEAAAPQGAFWEVERRLTEALARPRPRRLDGAALLGLARESGVDLDRLRHELLTPEPAARILRDFRGALRSGVNGAPTYYVQGVRQDIDEPAELRERLERLLSGDTAALWAPRHTQNGLTRRLLGQAPAAPAGRSSLSASVRPTRWIYDFADDPSPRPVVAQDHGIPL